MYTKLKSIDLRIKHTLQSIFNCACSIFVEFSSCCAHNTGGTGEDFKKCIANLGNNIFTAITIFQ